MSAPTITHRNCSANPGSRQCTRPLTPSFSNLARSCKAWSAHAQKMLFRSVSISTHRGYTTLVATPASPLTKQYGDNARVTLDEFTTPIIHRGLPRVSFPPSAPRVFHHLAGVGHRVERDHRLQPARWSHVYGNSLTSSPSAPTSERSESRCSECSHRAGIPWGRPTSGG
jgi:hypothetical protein